MILSKYLKIIYNFKIERRDFALVVKRISRQASNLLVEVQFLPRAPKQNSTAFSKPICGTREARWLEAESYARIVPPLPRFTRQPQKEKMFLTFRICARPIFSKNGKDIFIFGFRLPSIQAGGWASMRTRFCENYFLGILIFAKPRLIFLARIQNWIPPAERGLGNECGRVFCFEFFACKN